MPQMDITMDESEMCNSDYSDEELRIIFQHIEPRFRGFFLRPKEEDDG